MQSVHQIIRYSIKNATFYLLVVIVLIMFSCRTTRHISTEKVRIMGAGRLYTLVTENYLPYNSISIKFYVNIKFDDVERSISGTLRIRKDSLIWISITPALGIEMARIQFTPDSIMFMNKLKDEYFKKSYDYFDNKFQTDLSFNDLQAFFSNEIFLYSETDEEHNEKINADNKEKGFFRKTFIPSTDSNMYVLKTHRKHKIKKYIKKNKTTDLIVETLHITPDIFKISKVAINDYGEKRTLNIQYFDFIDVNSKAMPSKINIDINTAEKHLTTEIKYNKITVNSDVSFPFKIPDKYKRID